MTATHATPDELSDAPEPAPPPPGRHGRRALPAQRHRARNGHAADDQAAVVGTSLEPTAARLAGPAQFEAATILDRPVAANDTLAARAQVLRLVLAMHPLDPATDPKTASRLRTLFAQADPTPPPD